MGSSRDNKAGKGKFDTSKNLDLPTTIQPTPTSGSTRPTITPAITHGKSTADVATVIDTVAKTLVSSNASNVQTTPRIPVKRPHEGSVIPNFSRTKASDQATAVKSRPPSGVDGRPVEKTQPAKAKSEQAKDDESDEIESLFAAYRPVDGTGGARQSSTNPLTRGLNPVELIMASTATTTSNTASEASRGTATTFNTIGVDDTATGVNKAIANTEDPTSLFGEPSAAGTNPNTTSTPPKSFFAAPNSSQTKSLSLFGVTATLGRPEQKSNTSGASTLPIDFGTAPTPNPATTSPFGVLKITETPPTPNTAPTSQFSVLSMLDTAPTSNPTTESPFGGLKMANTNPKTNLAIESRFDSLKMAGTAPKPNLATYSPFSSSKAPSTAPVPNLATTSPFGLFKMPHTAPGPNPAITSPSGVFETAPTPIPATTSLFGGFKIVETAPTPNPATTNPFGAFKMAETAPKPNLATNSPFGVFNMADTARTPNSATKSLFSTVKTPAETSFSKSNFPESDIGDSQVKGLFGYLSEQTRQSKSNSFGFGPTRLSPSPFTTSKVTEFHTVNGDSLETYNPAIFNESKLPPIKPDFNPEMAIAEGLFNTYQPMVPYGHYQSKNHSLSSPFKSLQSDNALPSANITGNSTTQQTGIQFGGSPFAQTTNDITFQKTENLITYQKHIQELQSSKAWLSEQNEIISRNLAISTENLGLCGAQLQYFSSRCNDLNETYKECRGEIAKLQEELDKVNKRREVEKEMANLALELLKKEKYTNLSRNALYVHVLACILITWLAMSFHKWIF